MRAQKQWLVNGQYPVISVLCLSLAKHLLLYKNLCFWSQNWQSLKVLSKNNLTQSDDLKTKMSKLLVHILKENYYFFTWTMVISWIFKSLVGLFIQSFLQYMLKLLQLHVPVNYVLLIGKACSSRSNIHDCPIVE